MFELGKLVTDDISDPPDSVTLCLKKLHACCELSARVSLPVKQATRNPPKIHFCH